MGFKDSRFVKPTPSNNGPTRFLYLASDKLLSNELSLEVLTGFFRKYGELDYSVDGVAIDLIPNRRYCFISFLELESACKVLEYVDQHSPEDSDFCIMFGQKFMIKYAIERVESRPPPEPDCTSLTDHVVVPGLHVIPNFISELEEQALLDEFGGDSAPWKESLQRRVQHYGFPFNYRTLMLDYTKPTPPLPPSCLSLGQRMNETFVSMEPTSNTSLPLNQLTLNEYMPGQGIASHTGMYVLFLHSKPDCVGTDTEACFGPILYILNLGHGIVMNLTKKLVLFSLFVITVLIL